MKLSIEDFDNPEKAELCLRAIIQLNGETVERCIEADEEGGYVVRYAVDKDGNMYLNEDDNPATERLEGVVRIIDPEQE